jgi:hypothetical protein
MNTSEHPSKSKIAAGIALALLGKLGLVISSLYSLNSVIFFGSSDPFRPLRVFLVLGVSILFLVGAARMFRDGHWWQEFIRSLPLIICCFGCLGVVGTVANIWTRRQPHSVTGYEESWFFICLVGFLLCIFIFRRSKRRKNHAA